MSHRSLKEAYVANKIAVIEHKASKNLEEIVTRNVTARVIIEAIDPEDLRVTSEMIKKLRELVSTTSLKSVAAAVVAAQDELNRASEGTISSKIWGKLKSLGYKNPYLKALTLANSLETGFSQLKTILQNNGVDIEADKDKPLNRVLNAQRLESLKKQIINAFVPSGTFSVFKKMPFIDSGKFAAEIVTVPLNSVLDLSDKTQQVVGSAEQATADIVTAAKEDPQGAQEQPAQVSQDKPQSQTQKVTKTDLEDRVKYYRSKGMDGTDLIAVILKDYGLKVENASRKK
jgi:hypothetical protein